MQGSEWREKPNQMSCRLRRWALKFYLLTMSPILGEKKQKLIIFSYLLNWIWRMQWISFTEKKVCKAHFKVYAKVSTQLIIKLVWKPQNIFWYSLFQHQSSDQWSLRQKREIQINKENSPCPQYISAFWFEHQVFQSQSE